MEIIGPRNGNMCVSIGLAHVMCVFCWFYNELRIAMCVFHSFWMGLARNTMEIVSPRDANVRISIEFAHAMYVFCYF